MVFGVKVFLTVKSPILGEDLDETDKKTVSAMKDVLIVRYGNGGFVTRIGI